MRFDRFFVFLVLFVALLCGTAHAGWVYSGTPSWYYWQNADGSYDGWNYFRTHNYGGYHYLQHSRYREADASRSPPLTAYSWRDRVVEILAKRNERYARMQEAAVDHAAFMETAQALQLAPPDLAVSLPGGAYGAYGASHGQQTIYGTVTAPLADAYRNFDVEARMAQLQRLDEQVAAGSVQMSSETRRTLREAIKTYEHVKGTQLRSEAVSNHVRELKELLDGAKPSEASDGPASGGRQSPEGESSHVPESQGAHAPRSPITLPAAAAVIASKCVECHGPTRSEKGLRLDFPDVLVKRRADIVDRIFRKDDKVMPPPDKEPLTPLEKAAFALGK
jgi:hypothetical protein